MEEIEGDQRRQEEENAIDALTVLAQAQNNQQATIDTSSSEALDQQDQNSEEDNQEEDDNTSRIEDDADMEERISYLERLKDDLQTTSFTFQEGISPQGGGESTFSNKTARDHKIKMGNLRSDFNRKEQARKTSQATVPFIHRKFDLLKKPQFKRQLEMYTENFEETSESNIIHNIATHHAYRKVREEKSRTLQ